MYFTNIFLTEEYSKILLLLIVSLVLSTVLLIVSLILAQLKPDTAKSSTYECGFEPYEDARNMFDVRFYLIAILFLVFDLETAYFFPWVLSVGSLNVEGFWIMIEFGLELLFGFIYAWNLGALDWK